MFADFCGIVTAFLFTFVIFLFSYFFLSLRFPSYRPLHSPYSYSTLSTTPCSSYPYLLCFAISLPWLPFTAVVSCSPQRVRPGSRSHKATDELVLERCFRGQVSHWFICQIEWSTLAPCRRVPTTRPYSFWLTDSPSSFTIRYPARIFQVACQQRPDKPSSCSFPVPGFAGSIRCRLQFLRTSGLPLEGYLSLQFVAWLASSNILVVIQRRGKGPSWELTTAT